MHVRLRVALGVLVVTAACSPPVTVPPTPRFSVGGTVGGFEPALGTLTLQLNGGAQTLEVAANGSFAFTDALESGSAYAVTIVAHPAEQDCAVTAGEGTVTATVDTIGVQCSTHRYPVGGLARGVDRPGLALREALSGQSLTLPVDAGAFAFALPITWGQPYSVSTTALPTGRDCVVSFGGGTVRGVVDGVRVDCAPRLLPLAVTLEGIDVDGVRLDETATAQQLSVDAGATSAAFAQPLRWETAFVVSVTAPANSGRTCSIDGGLGVVGEPMPVPHVTCEKQRFSVGGQITNDAGSFTLAERTTAQSLDAGSGAFTFPATIEWDTAIDVELDAQPADAFCRIDGGTRVVRGTIDDITVTCARGFPVGGQIHNLRGAGLTLAQASTGQQLAITQTGSQVAFRFADVVPDGEPLGVTIAQHPQGQTCRLDAPSTSTVTAPVNDLSIFCGPRTTDLVINEVGSVAGAQAPFWVELYNGTAQPIALGSYTLRSGARFTDGGVGPNTAFSLPDASVPPASAFVISSKPSADLHDYPAMRFVVQSNLTPAPGGALQLERGATGIDAVAFEDAGVPSGWIGAGLVLPEGASDFGRSLARAQQPDGDQASDFAVCDFPTPGGINDVCTSPDADQDGLPDVAEAAGTTWNELPLYDWGARALQRDVFVEIDWLPPDGFNGTFDPAILPRREALEHVRQVFANHAIALHFDTGALFHPAPGWSAADFDLGGGNQTAWGCTLSLAGTSGVTSFYKLKADNTDLRRLLSFHHVQFANALADVTCANSGAGTSGTSELGGNDLTITLGRTGLSLATTSGVNQVINWQSSTLMHELGHNLGLRHGGFEDQGYKPNYLSVMNYMYQFDGLPVLGQNEGDRFYRQFVLLNVCTGAPGITSASGLNRNRFSTPASWGLDYSDGTSLTLNEAALDENLGFGRAGSSAIDWNWNTTIEAAPVSADVNALGITPRVCPRTNPGTDLVRDHDDWSALVMTFLRTPRGSASGAPTRRLPQPGPLRFDPFDDHQPLVTEQPAPR